MPPTLEDPLLPGSISPETPINPRFQQEASGPVVDAPVLEVALAFLMRGIVQFPPLALCWLYEFGMGE